MSHPAARVLPVTTPDAPAVLAPDVPAPGAPVQATVIFVGDLVPHTDVIDAADAYGLADLLAPIAPMLRAADLAIVNLETPVSDSRPVSRAAMRFNVHAPFLGALTAAGVDAVSSANNHVFDMGVAGVDETVRALRASGLRALGAALAGEDPLAPQEFPLAGSTLCVFAATRLLNYDMELPGADRARVALARPEFPAEEDALLGAIRGRPARCGAVLVSLHTGSEYDAHETPQDRAFFRRVAEAGADAIVGHHPHVPMRAVWIDVNGRRVPAFYSVGNVLSNQGESADVTLYDEHPGPLVSLDPRTRAGLLAALRFEPCTPAPRLCVVGAGYLPLWTVNTHRVDPDAPPRITATLMPRAGEGDRGLELAWERTLRDADPEMLLSHDDLAGGGESYALSLSVVRAYRHTLAVKLRRRATRVDGADAGLP